MRYDIYKILTEGLTACEKEEKFKEVFSQVFPKDLQFHVESLEDKNFQINFDIKDTVSQLIAKINISNFENTEPICIVTNISPEQEKKFFSKETINSIKYEKEEEKEEEAIIYSCVEILEGNVCNLYTALTIYITKTKDTVPSITNVCFGNWLYDKQIPEKNISLVLKDLLTTDPDIDVYKQLKEEQKALHSEQNILPDYFITLESLDDNMSKANLNVDGKESVEHIQLRQTFFKSIKNDIANLLRKHNSEMFQFPDIIEFCNQNISFNVFNTKDFIENKIAVRSENQQKVHTKTLK